METFSTTDVVKILDVKYPRLREWIDRGYLTPFVKPEGSGSRTLFSFKDLCLAKVFLYLINMGYSRNEASDCVNAIATVDFVVKDFAVITYHVGDIKPKTALINKETFEGVPGSILMGGNRFKGAVIINLAEVRRDIKSCIDAL